MSIEGITPILNVSDVPEGVCAKEAQVFLCQGGRSEHRSLRRTSRTISRTLARVRSALAVFLTAALGAMLALVLGMRRGVEAKPVIQPVLTGSLSARPAVPLESEPAAAEPARVSDVASSSPRADEARPGLAAEAAAAPEVYETYEPEDASVQHGLCGQVLLPDGAPAEFASVCFNYANAVTDSSGWFCIPFDDLGFVTIRRSEEPLSSVGSVTVNRTVRLSEDSFSSSLSYSTSLERFWAEWPPVPGMEVPLVASLEGYGPAILPDAAALWQASFPNDPPTITLVLSDDMRAIGGCLEDQNGRSLHGWRVEVRDLSVPSGCAGRQDTAVTDRLGIFSTDGLLPGSYYVRAYDPRTLLSVERENVMAGTEDLELRARTDTLLPLVRGRIVSPDGTPLSKVEVKVRSRLWLDRSGTVTDSSGVFELRDVPREGVKLVVSGYFFESSEHEIEGLNPLAIEIVVAPLCSFVLVADDGSWEGTRFSILDENGQELNVATRDRESAWRIQTRHAVVDAIGSLCRVGENGRVLRLLEGDEELFRRAIDLEPDELNTLRLERP